MAAILGGGENEENDNKVIQPNIIGISNDIDRSIRDYAIFDPEKQ